MSILAWLFRKRPPSSQSMSVFIQRCPALLQHVSSMRAQASSDHRRPVHSVWGVAWPFGKRSHLAVQRAPIHWSPHLGLLYAVLACDICNALGPFMTFAAEPFRESPRLADSQASSHRSSPCTVPTCIACPLSRTGNSLRPVQLSAEPTHAAVAAALS